MSFLYPLFLLGGVVVAIPIVLHLLRRDVAPEVPFSAVRLLRRTPLEQTRHHTLRELLLLAARVAALALLAAAFARPYFASAADAPLHVVAIDRSYSMGAPGRFDRALELARGALDASAANGRVALVAFDDRADVLAVPGARGLAGAALQRVRPSHGGTRYAPVVARAIELGEGDPVRLTVVTDLQRAGWEDQEPIRASGLEVEWLDAGAPPGNAAVVSASREPAAIVATVRNTGSEVVAGAARVVHEGTIVASAEYSAPGGATVDVSIPYRAPESGNLAVEIDDANGYPADNRRYVLLDAPDRPVVLIVGSDEAQAGYFLKRALEAPAGEEALAVRATTGASLGRMAPQDLSKVQSILLLTTKGLDRRAHDLLPAFVRAGGGLFVAAGQDVAPSVLGGLMGWSDFSAIEQQGDGRALAATDLRHPIFRPFGAVAANLGQVRFTTVWRVRGAGWNVAARFTDGSPALLERAHGQGRVVLFASDLDRRWNDFPLHPGFVPFALATVRHIGRASETRRDYLVSDPPRGARAEPGVYVLDEDRRRVSVNVDLREAGIERMSADELTAMVQVGSTGAATPRDARARQTESRQNLWRYGLILMLGALVAESLLGRSR